jgi:hypothetical protein
LSPLFPLFEVIFNVLYRILLLAEKKMVLDFVVVQNIGISI